MRVMDWTARVVAETMKRRALGPSRWNAWRRDMMQYRRAQLPGLLLKLGVGIGDRGAQARVVEALGLSRQTISRDFRALVDSMRARRSCPVCRCSVEHLWERP